MKLLTPKLSRYDFFEYGNTYLTWILNHFPFWIAMDTNGDWDKLKTDLFMNRIFQVQTHSQSDL